MERDKSVDDFELDTIYEVSTINDNSYWLTEDSYKAVLHAIETETFSVEVEAIYGIKSTLIVRNISTLDKSTREQRELSRQLNKKYRELEIEKKKESWE